MNGSKLLKPIIMHVMPVSSKKGIKKKNKKIHKSKLIYEYIRRDAEDLRIECLNLWLESVV